MKVAGLYAGIGGFELGFQSAGFETLLLADKDDSCRTVLSTRFPGAAIAGDVSSLSELPAGTTVVTAGFPCQNLSMAGDKVGIGGAKSGDVNMMFELLTRSHLPTLALENVYFMLSVDAGRAMQSLVDRIEGLGYAWAYRVVDTRSFGLPHRRRRVFMIASKEVDPRAVLFADEAGRPLERKLSLKRPIGFYWTEGRSGVGLADDSIPPLKGGSGLGIPSAPAVLFPDGRVEMPSLESCESLQGFEPGWTALPFTTARSPRWTMIGNAVSVPASGWVASRLAKPGIPFSSPTTPLVRGGRWPAAAFGEKGVHYRVEISEFPFNEVTPSLETLRDGSWKPLSHRALTGFYKRAKEGSLRFPDGFLAAIKKARDAALT
ncbi:DNA (cytosine-5-)-methyltransferase [Sphingosinicella sp. LHD-64]|uniref:DNA cytosine methyltransferase n=1 Tax=Sphingosinicella sp. LHD-64 TaxID=3072139 RepID=UPI00280FF7A8|nr:DNA (cytosine-5-)-methyltransferase [Sphingosinicella sp. LHD-64]MDQ8754732.1 DNA (cytosine-5-)-methyltransferase [Sphingosinicella sp. LHD-64]